MASDATDLSSLLGNAPIQNSPEFAPMVTGGGNPFISPIPSQQYSKPPDYSATFSAIRYSVRGLMTYIAFFLATAIISLSTPRTLILQYIPNTYTSGGVVSYTGAGVLGGAAVIIAYVLSTLLQILI